MHTHTCVRALPDSFATFQPDPFLVQQRYVPYYRCEAESVAGALAVPRATNRSIRRRRHHRRRLLRLRRRRQPHLGVLRVGRKLALGVRSVSTATGEAKKAPRGK